MLPGIDSRIDVFCEALERADSLQAELRMLECSIFHHEEKARRLKNDDLSDYERRWLTDSLHHREHVHSLRTRRVKAEIALRKALPSAIEAKGGALDAVVELLIKAVGGRAGLLTFPFARYHYLEMARHRPGPSLRLGQDARLAHLRETWKAIDFAIGSLQQIEFEARGESARCC